MFMSDNNFDNSFKDVFDNFEAEPGPKVWAAVKEELGKEKRKKRVFWFFLSGAAALLIGGLFFFVDVMNRKSTEVVNNTTQVISKINTGKKSSTITSEQNVEEVKPEIKKPEIPHESNSTSAVNNNTSVTSASSGN